MYAPKTIGFPPSRASVLHIPSGATIVSSSRPFGSAPIGGNPFAVRATVGRKGSMEGGSSWVHLGGSPFGSFSSLRPVLRPSQLGSNLDSPSAANKKNLCPLRPSRLGNPFAKTAESVADESKPKPTEKSTCSSLPTSKSKEPDGPVFVPLGTPLNSRKDDGSPFKPASSANFVFGQNLHTRVSAASPASSSSSLSEAATNGASDMLFSAALKKDHVEKKEEIEEQSPQDRPAKSLTESAREYEESRAIKRKYEEVIVITGEEDESNVIQMNVKLFAFNKDTSTWVERGRGQLRLNDKDAGSGAIQSRLIMRTQGSLRVVLNTKVWSAMCVAKPSPKSVQITAMDGEQIKVFLIMASTKETEMLFNALEWRIATLRTQEESSGVSHVSHADVCTLDDSGIAVPTKRKRSPDRKGLKEGPSSLSCEVSDKKEKQAL